MTSVTQNGWSRYGPIKKYNPPQTSCNAIYLNPTAAPILLYVIRRFHNEVAGHDASPLQCWGFARSGPIGNSGIYSNHESGTAVDLNATHYPWGTDRMSASDEAKCRAIVKACGGIIRWGGDYNRKLDQMHWEINDGVSKAEVLAQIKKMRLNPDGTVKPKTAKFNYPRRLQQGSAPAWDIAHLRAHLKMEPGNSWGPVMTRKVGADRKRLGLPEKPRILDEAYAHKMGATFKGK